MHLSRWRRDEVSWYILAVVVRLRHRLSWVVGAWLLCQTAALAAGPFELVRISIADLCQCGTGEGATCPMHHHGTPASSDKQCQLQKACTPLDSVLLSFAGGIGVLNEGLVVEPYENATSAAISSQQLQTRVEFPDSPPPRL